MPHLEQLWNEFKGKGLHIYHVESQNHSPQQIRAFCDRYGATFPQVERIPVENHFDEYELGNRVPYAYVIGVDGTVIHQGKDGYQAVIREEMKKVRYPGLGTQSVARPVETAARQYGQRAFGKAISTATKTLGELRGEEAPDAAAIADARRVIERAERVGQRELARAKEALAAREYIDVMSAYRALSKQFKGHEFGTAADAELKRIKRDKGIQKELKALIAFEKLMAKLAGAERDVREKMLRKFADKHDGMRAGEKALQAI